MHLLDMCKKPTKTPYQNDKVPTATLHTDMQTLKLSHNTYYSRRSSGTSISNLKNVVLSMGAFGFLGRNLSLATISVYVFSQPKYSTTWKSPFIIWKRQKLNHLTKRPKLNHLTIITYFLSF